MPVEQVVLRGISKIPVLEFDSPHRLHLSLLQSGIASLSKSDSAGSIPDRDASLDFQSEMLYICCANVAKWQSTRFRLWSLKRHCGFESRHSHHGSLLKLVGQDRFRTYCSKGRESSTLSGATKFVFAIELSYIDCVRKSVQHFGYSTMSFLNRDDPTEQESELLHEIEHLKNSLNGVVDAWGKAQGKRASYRIRSRKMVDGGHVPRNKISQKNSGKRNSNRCRRVMNLFNPYLRAKLRIQILRWISKIFRVAIITSQQKKPLRVAVITPQQKKR